jgi:putative ABC transport system substrate-binding protein
LNLPPRDHASLSRELVGLQVDVLLAAGTPAIHAAKSATGSIPILMVGSLDPLRAGFVQSLARPGGNITGLSSDVTAETWRKRLQLLIEAVPSTSRVALLWSRQTQKTSDFILEEVRDAASKLKVMNRNNRG